MVLCRATSSILFRQPEDASIFSGCNLWHFVRVANDTVANAFIIPLYAKPFEDFLAYFHLKFFLGSVNPATPQALSISRLYQLSHQQAASVDIGGPIFRSQHDEHHRATIERIKGQLPAVKF